MKVTLHTRYLTGVQNRVGGGGVNYCYFFFIHILLYSGVCVAAREDVVLVLTALVSKRVVGDAYERKMQNVVPSDI